MRLLLSILLLLSLASPALAGEMRVYTELTGNALIKARKVAVPKGESLPIVQELMRRAGVDSEIMVVPWKRGYNAALNEADVALFPTTYTKLREKLFNWVGPLFRLKWLFIAKKGSGIIINSLEDAKRVGSIGTYHLDAREQFLKQQGFRNLHSTVGSINNYRKLVDGRLDLMVTSSLGIVTAAKMAGVSTDELEVVYTIREVDLYVAISKKTDPEVVRVWKEAYQSMIDDGTYQRLYKEWQPLEEPPLNPLPPQ